MKKFFLIPAFIMVMSSLMSQNTPIPESLFLQKTRLQLTDFPTDRLPKGVEGYFVTVYMKGEPVCCDGISVSVHGKTNTGYLLIDSLLVEILHNPAKDPRAEYKNGQIHVVSGIPMNESKAIAKFSFDGMKLIFIENDIFDPNEDLNLSIDSALTSGDIKLAGELALGLQSPPFGYLESFQMTLLLRAHEVAMEFSKKKEYKKAAETMGYAYDFFNGINEGSDIKPDSKEAKAIADYTYFLLNIKDYKKCIEVSKVCTKLSPNLAGPYLHLGNSFFEIGEKEEAKKAYEKFVELRKANKEENRIPAYVYERMNSGKPIAGKPEAIVYEFFKWYFNNKINEMELTNWNRADIKFYRVNFTATENYLKKIQATGFVSQSYIDHWRTYFKKCDEAFLKEKQNDGPPSGFEFDFITNSQENPEKVVQTDFKLIEMKANNARVKYAGYLVYLLQRQEGKWRITGIETN